MGISGLSAIFSPLLYDIYSTQCIIQNLHHQLMWCEYSFKNCLHFSRKKYLYYSAAALYWNLHAPLSCRLLHFTLLAQWVVHAVQEIILHTHQWLANSAQWYQ